MSSLKLRLSKLEGKVMAGNIYETLLVKHCKLDKWGIPSDKGAQMHVVVALAIKDFADHPKHDEAISVLKWASTVPELELIERAERILDDYVSAGLFPATPSPWTCDTVDPNEVMPPYAGYCDRNQLAKFRQCTLFQ